MTETPEAQPTNTEAEPVEAPVPTDPISAAVAPGYAFEGPALELGA